MPSPKELQEAVAQRGPSDEQFAIDSMTSMLRAGIRLGKALDQALSIVAKAPMLAEQQSLQLKKIRDELDRYRGHFGLLPDVAPPAPTDAAPEGVVATSVELDGTGALHIPKE